MKKTYFLIIAIIGLVSITIAQPTLTTANFVPLINDSQYFHVADTNTILDNTIGANVIFNYSMMRGYGLTQTQYIVDPTTTQYTGDFPSATYADTTGGFPINKNYKKVEALDSLTNIGLVADVTTYGTVIARYNNDPETIMKFPFNYGDSYMDAYSGTFTVQAVTTNGLGDATVNADAWGTLILPLGVSIDSVLRVRTVEHLETDTIVIPFPPITILPVVIDAEYVNYYKPSISKFPLVSFISGTYTQDNNTLDSSTVIISQYPMPGVGINELEETINLELFPNPTNKEVVNIVFDVESNSSLRIDLINQVGQKVKVIYNGKTAPGKNRYKVETTNLSAGIYYVNIFVGDKATSRKLIVQ